MHPAISYHLAQAHIADLRHRAERDIPARAARLARGHQRGYALLWLEALGRRAQAVLVGITRLGPAPRLLNSLSKERHDHHPE